MVFRSIAKRLGHYQWFARTGRFLVPADRFVSRLTKGRVVALGLVPSLLLTTTGRRSGRLRSNPVSYVRDGDSFVVIGSNWGRPEHPGWSSNLLAHPRAMVSVDGRAVPVRAVLVTGPDRARLRDRLVQLYPAYATYEKRAAGRHLRIFRLDPVG